MSQHAPWSFGSCNTGVKSCCVSKQGATGATGASGIGTTGATGATGGAGGQGATGATGAGQSIGFLSNRTQAQTGLAPGTVTLVTFPLVQFDDGGNYTAGTSTFTAPVSGRYQMNVDTTISMTNVNTGSAAFAFGTEFFLVNGVTRVGAAGFSQNMSPSSTINQAVSLGALLNLIAFDTVTVGLANDGDPGTQLGIRPTATNPNSFSGFLAYLTTGDTP